VAGLSRLDAIPPLDAGILAACAAIGFFGGRLLRLPAAPLVGPMIASAAVHLSGVTAASPPNEIVNLAQVVMGTAIGCRFAGFDLRRVLGTMAIAGLVTIYMVAMATAFALVLERLTGLPFTALILAFAPGGLAEMTLVSLALGIDTAFVSTHHVFRLLILVLGAPLALMLFERAFGKDGSPG
jgi:membrane AbrB-like protein